MNSPTHPKGVTLIELTVVISVILTLLSTLFLGASYYRDSASQATCIAQITQMQKAIRSYQNLENLPYNHPITESDVVGADKALGEAPQCPLGGGYTFLNRIPNLGEQFATCTNYGGPPEEHFIVDTSGL
jgi:prepilin-type N-terminal cleavage/methylation domain-containing protein